MTEEIIHNACGLRVEECACKNPRVSIIRFQFRDALAFPFGILSLLLAYVAISIGGAFTATQLILQPKDLTPPKHD